MDPLLELIAKGGIGLLAGYLIIRWLADALKLLWLKLDERIQAMMARADAMQKRCDDERVEVQKQLEQVRDHVTNSLMGALRTFADAAHLQAKALEMQAKNETGKHEALDRREHRA